MTFLNLEQTSPRSETTLISTLVRFVKAILPRPVVHDGETAARQNALRAEARANVDRLLR